MNRLGIRDTGVSPKNLKEPTHEGKVMRSKSLLQIHLRDRRAMVITSMQQQLGQRISLAHWANGPLVTRARPSEFSPRDQLNQHHNIEEGPGGRLPITHAKKRAGVMFAQYEHARKRRACSHRMIGTKKERRSGGRQLVCSALPSAPSRVKSASVCIR